MDKKKKRIVGPPSVGGGGGGVILTSIFVTGTTGIQTQTAANSTSIGALMTSAILYLKFFKSSAFFFFFFFFKFASLSSPTLQCNGLSPDMKIVSIKTIITIAIKLLQINHHECNEIQEIQEMKYIARAIVSLSNSSLSFVMRK